MDFTLEIASIAYRDLSQIKAYIALDKPDIAKKIVKKLTTAIRSLPSSPYISTELRKKFGLDADLRGRIVKPHIIIYDVKNSHIKVYRVLDCRSDYLSTLGFRAEIYDADDE